MIQEQQVDQDSGDLDLCSEALGVESSMVVRGPWLQSPGPASVTVCWDTARNSESVLYFAEAGDELSRVWLGDDHTVAQHHVAEVVGLKVSTWYEYCVGVPSDENPVYRFRTPPAVSSKEPLRLMVLADSGRPGDVQDAVKAGFEKFEPHLPPQALLLLGDLAYESGTAQEFIDGFYTPYQELLATVPSISCPGNHEEMTSNSATESGPYYDYAHPQVHGELGGIPSHTRAYYSMDIGQVHIISINTTDSLRLDATQRKWIEEDLAQSDALWKIAIFHQPPYSFGSRNSDVFHDQREVREQLIPLLEEGGVDLVLNGHSHSREFSYLLNGHHGDSQTFDAQHHIVHRPQNIDETHYYEVPDGDEPRGILYLIAGTSSRTDKPGCHPAMIDASGKPASLFLDIQEHTLIARFVDEDGQAESTIVFRKTP